MLLKGGLYYLSSVTFQKSFHLADFEELSLPSFFIFFFYNLKIVLLSLVLLFIKVNLFFEASVNM